MVKQSQSYLMGLRQDRFFSPGFWGDLIDKCELLSGIAIPNNIFQQYFSKYQFSTSESLPGFRILPGTSLRDSKIAVKLESMSWYGCPGRILFFSNQSSVLKVLQDHYEIERMSIWPDWANEMRNLIGLLMGGVENVLVCWCFSFDADFAVCSLRVQENEPV